jgi:ABC-type multidrug transport system, ATPase component
MIETENLTKKYGDLVAIKELSFKVEKGKIWGLLGPNAAGKTTTMRILTGYLPATEGRAVVAGYDVFEQAEAVKQSIGYLPETVPLYPEMTVESYLGFVAEIKKVPKSQKKAAIDRTVEIAGLKSVRKRLIKNISRGYRQRVGIAQAIIHNPQVIILDEPTIGLDPAQIVEIRQLIRSLKEEHTVMLSTHILAEVTQVCDGVVIINEGKLMASGSLEELTKAYKEKEGLYLRLKKADNEVLNLFRQLPGIEKADLEGSEIKLEWSKGKDLREQVVRLCLEKQLGLLEMRSTAINIEELYLRIVSGGRNNERPSGPLLKRNSYLILPRLLPISSSPFLSFYPGSFFTAWSGGLIPRQCKWLRIHIITSRLTSIRWFLPRSFITLVLFSC